MLGEAGVQEWDMENGDSWDIFGTTLGWRFGPMALFASRVYVLDSTWIQGLENAGCLFNTTTIMCLLF